MTAENSFAHRSNRGYCILAKIHSKTPPRVAGRRTKVATLAASTLVALGATSLAASTTGTPGVAPVVARASAAPGDAAPTFPPASPCPREGDRGDPLLNDQKNRFASPQDADISPKILTAADVIALPVPALTQGALRTTWSASDASEVGAIEARAATVEGFIVAVINENKAPGESSNCHRAAELHDFHIFVADEPGTPKSEAVVVEMTPRWRAAHPSWEDAKHGPAPIQQIVANKTRVRVTGWLMLDEEHLSVVGTERATVWELHPVTKLETQSGNGTWTAL